MRAGILTASTTTEFSTVQQARTGRTASREPKSGSPGSLREEIRAALEAVRLRVCAEIGAHPRPVAGCDVDFNRLLEDRARLAQELARLDALDRVELERFVADSPDLDAATRRGLRASLQRAFAGD
mgnify:CR=1 FL=1